RRGKKKIRAQHMHMEMNRKSSSVYSHSVTQTLFFGVFATGTDLVICREGSASPSVDVKIIGDTNKKQTHLL
ncbi:unnamed protein product, partial [Amoebophrya sp. A25]